MGARFLKLFLLPLSLFAVVTGNPGDPGLLNRGLINKCAWWSFRVGYMGDYVYKERFLDEVDIAGCLANTSFVKLYTNAATMTFNLKKRVDFYGILGASKMQLDEEIFSKTRFAWGAGVKIVLYKASRWMVGVDFKYFETEQKPLYFICDHFAYNIINNYLLKYNETQGSLGITYRSKYVAPYISANYISSKIAPTPSTALVRLPMIDFLVGVPTKSVINQYHWGVALGATLIDLRKASLSFEWRAINQNSIDILGQLRF